MEKIRLFDKTFKTFIPYDKIMKAVDDVAEKINEDFRGCQDIPVLLCVLNGSIMFTAELMKRIDFNCEIVSVKLTSYEGTSSTGTVRQAMGLTLFKPDSYKKDIPLDYVAIQIPNDFIVGFGLDYNEIGRNLKDIYVLDE